MSAPEPDATNNQAEAACPRCGTTPTGFTQHYQFTPAPRDPLKHGQPGTNVLGAVEVEPCGCRLSPADADATWGGVSS